MIRVCPERDARCPHGLDCPYSIDRYRCDRRRELEDAVAGRTLNELREVITPSPTPESPQ